MQQTAEHLRLAECRDAKAPWRRWGPYLAERQWGTVREDYSERGDAWDHFSHDQARSRAYRWGEDGLAGISDDRQALCFALALWNGRDPILKERPFGLTNGEGNHGEDVKDYYFYLDSTPTHSYMRYLYKYPQCAFPYDELVRTNRARGRHEFEHELLDTGAFDGDRYFDVFVEYAKADPDDILIRVTVCNRGPEAASLHVLPTLWFRNTWSWTQGAAKPSLHGDEDGVGNAAVTARHDELGQWVLRCERRDLPALFVENETNERRVFGRPGGTPYPKDGINDCVVHGRADAVNPAVAGTKAALVWHIDVPPHGQTVLRLRLSEAARSAGADAFGPAFDATFAARTEEADAFYRAVAPAAFSEDEARVFRQALSGMLWSKQYYLYDVHRWLKEQGSAPRNREWGHMYNAHVISMPDKWEYPWYAAWDLAFHTLALGLVDADFAKDQLALTLREGYLHPNGQIPAYEWNFGDVNPPVHAWAGVFLYQLDAARRGGEGDHRWLAHNFEKLLLNFGWWLNRKDRGGRNAFEGGFLGLDNIGVFDRSAPLPTGGHLEQADGTAWMAVFCQHMLEMAVELSRRDPLYEDMVLRFAHHFLSIGSALVRLGDEGMWDEAEGFFYDVLRLPDGSATRLKVRSLVGLLPLCAAAVVGPEQVTHLDETLGRLRRLLQARPELADSLHPLGRPGHAGRHLLSVVDEEKLRRVLSVMLDEGEFLGPHGIRSLSRRHAEQPFVLRAAGQEYRVGYLPAESDSGMFGGNSNWRGPVWMPMNAILVRALLTYYTYYGDAFTVECPTGSGRHMTLFEVAREITRRLTAIFLRGEDGRRPVFGGIGVFQEDPHWRDCLLFHEYFHGDNGAGLGASHQTGWTGLVAPLMHFFASTSAADVLSGAHAAAFKGLAGGAKE